MQVSNFKNWISTEGQCAALFLLLAAGAMVIPNATASAQSNEILSSWQTTDDRQFDFWIGKWDVNLRIKQADSTWKDSVDAKVEIYPILDGKAILELWDSSPIKGFSLRYFDHSKKKWVLYLNWPGHSKSSSLSSLTGQFRHGRGEFFSGSGKNISRYTFCDIAPNSLRWDDANSIDGGKTWTNNWIMEFSRTAKEARWPSGLNGHTHAPKDRCKGEQFELLGRMVGSWEGELDFGMHGGLRNAKVKVFRILGGCSVIRFMEYDDADALKKVNVFGILTWNAKRSSFEELILDNQKETNAVLYRGKRDDGTIRFVSESKIDGVQSGRVWTIPESKTGDLKISISVSSDDGKSWERPVHGQFKRTQEFEGKAMNDNEGAEEKAPAKTINDFCPRSGKPVSKECTTIYRGYVVGFCNPKCRDDFASDPEKSQSDRAFFDQIIDK